MATHSCLETSLDRDWWATVHGRAECRTQASMHASWVSVVACGIQLPDQGLHLGPLQRELSVLIDGPPGSSPKVF